MEKKPVLIILSFFAVYVFWGSTYLWNKMAVTELPPFMLASIRFTTASAIIFVIAVLSGKKLTITKKQLLNTVLAGFLFLAYGNGVFVWALKYVDSGFASLLASLQPLVLLLMMRFVQRKSLKIKSIIGVFLGLLGMYLLVSQKGLQMQEDSWIGIIMIMSCIISWSAGSLFVAKADTPSNFFITTGYQMLSAGVILAIGSWAFDESWSEPLSWQLNTQIAIICLILFGSIAAFTAFNYLLKVVSTEKVATSSYVNPIIALLLGWYFLNESITMQSMIAAAIMLTGVYFINSRKVR
ncbi:putative Inner membrane transport protein [Flavobacteria bacterium BBFL7]|nr:putative Inner membrane transport protein [Flavobacteria bacterium BBFL7]